MDASKLARKRERDDVELSMDTSQGSEGINKNLLKCLVVLTKHIIDVHNSKNDTHTEHNISKEPVVQIVEDDSLSRNISQLKEQTAALEKIYNKPKTNDSSCLSESFSQTNYKTIDSSLRACVVHHLSEHSANLTEQICNLISMYKSQQSEENARNIKKCLSKINKKIKSIPFQTNINQSACDRSDVFFSTINKSNLSTKESVYLSAAHNLSDKLTVLIKKVSKLKKVYKKRVLRASSCEPAVKKPKLLTNNESVITNNNTFDNSVSVNFNNDLKNNCSTPKKVKKSQRVKNNDDLNEISIVNNEKTRISLDKSIVTPDYSENLNSEIDPYLAVTHNGKTKHKSKEKSANLSKNSIVVEAIVHNENTDDVTTKKKKTKSNKTVENNEEKTKKSNKTVENNEEKTKKSNKTIENNELEDEVMEIESGDISNIIAEQKTKKKRKKKNYNSDSNISDSILNDIVHSICADLVQENENDLAAKRNNENEIGIEQNNESEILSERSVKKKRKKEEKISENVEENVIIIEPNDEVGKKLKRKKKKDSSNLEETIEIILKKNGDDSPSKNLCKKKIKNNENDTKNTEALLGQNNEKDMKKQEKRRIKSVEHTVDNSSESNKESLMQNNDIETLSTVIHKKKHKNTTMQEDLTENNETNNELSVKKIHKKTKVQEDLSENKENDSEKNNESTFKKKHKKKKSLKYIEENSTQEMNEVLVKENHLKNKLENSTEMICEESSTKKVKKKKKSIENATENTPEILVENNEVVPKKKHKKKKIKSISENSLENTEEILVQNNEINGKINNEMTVKKKRKKLNKSTENTDIKLSENENNVSVEIENNKITNNDFILKRKTKLTSENIDKENLSIIGRIIENIDKGNVPTIERISEKFNENRKSRSLLENNDENIEISDDILRSLLKVELFEDEKEYEQDANVNSVPWNSILQDEELDEKDQYLYLKEMVDTAKEKLELSEETKDRLRGLCVLLNFEVPRAHQIENRLCVGPTKEQAEQLAALGVKTGPLTKDEDEQIVRNWELFCKLHDIPNDPTPFLALQHGQNKYIPFEERRKFVQFLGRNLPHRPLHSIYRRFKVLYKVTKNGRFSEDEDKLILSYVKFGGHNTKFADLMTVLNRCRGAIEARYRALTKGETQKVSWDLELKAQLLKHMMTVMNVQTVKELQHADITHAQLSEIAKRMNLPVVKIRHQWCTKLYTQLFAANPLYLDQMRVDLVERLYELKIDDWRKVDWCEVAKTFPGVSPVSLRVLMKALFRNKCPKTLQADLGAIVDHCRLIVVPQLKERSDFNQRYIYRLKLQEDGSLEEYI